MKLLWLVIGNAALMLVVLAEEGWIEIVALAEIALFIGVLVLVAGWKESDAQQYERLADDALESLEQHRAYGQRVTDVNAAAVRALAEHDREQAAIVAGEFLDAYAIYRERMPDGDDGEPTYLDDYR